MTTASRNAPLPAGPAGPRRPIAAFDFDGTLTVKDSFTAFLAWRTSHVRCLVGLARIAPALLSYLLHRDRGRLKAVAVGQFLAGMPREALEGEAAAFAAQTRARLLRPDALACWEDWGRRGALRIIVTASPTAIVAPFARALGADELIGTELAYDAEGHVTGAFVTPNCRAQEKVTRLRARFGQDVRLAAAYGDTGGDTEMLAIAEVAGFRLFTGRPKPI